MSKRKYTTETAIAAINRYESILKWAEDCIAAKDSPPEHQSNYILPKTKDYFIGIINGAMLVCGTVLDAERCYFGFNYIDSKHNLIAAPVSNHPELKEWRVRHIVKEKKDNPE